MRSTRISVVVAALIFIACADEGPVSGPGTMTARVAGPNGPEGAALIVILDEAVREITPLGDTEVYSQVGGSGTQVVLINQTGGDLTFQLAVSDTTQPPAAVVQEVAGPDDELRSDLSRYTVKFNR